ncbi:MAG: hypothetical protein KA004_13010 [Verrucomicrobiales bacterium]|nr:hypothetical protein [Verrucomicrobiales bacterium]
MNEDSKSNPGASGPASAATDWTVEIEGKGRCGSVHYRESVGQLTFYWELGGGDFVAVINVGDEAAWRARHPWAAARRAEIMRRVAGAAVRQMSPGGRAEMDDKMGWINLRAAATVPPKSRARPDVSFVTRLTTFKFILGLIVLVLAVGAVALRKVFMIASPTGFPIALSVRTPQHVATLIQTLEPYVPSLHRNPANDRYRLALFLHPVDGRSAGRLIQIAKGFRPGELQLAKLHGCDGRTVWFGAKGLGGVNLATGKLVGPAELRAANPSLAEAWDDPRRISFAQRLRVTSPDRQTVLEVEPDTLRAVPARVERDAAKSPFELTLHDFLSVGARPSPTAWLGLLSPREAALEYRPKSWLRPFNRAADAKELRRFHRAALGPELDRGNREILSLEALPGDGYFNAAFVRADAKADPLRFSGPDGFLMIYTSAPGLTATLVVARVDTAGKVVWKTDTGIDRFTLKQILPDARFVAFVGTRPPVPEKVSEPILVIVETSTGALSTSSLWQ